jgi:hypothetical protein
MGSQGCYCDNFCVASKFLCIMQGQHGRQAMAKIDIPRGTIITRNKPTACVLRKDLRSSNCSNCFATMRSDKSNKPLLRCSRCHQAHYCCKECQVVDHPYHKVECVKLFAKDDKYNSYQNEEEMALMIRTQLALTRLPPYCEGDSFNARGIGIVQCSRHHWDSMVQAQGASVPAELVRVLPAIIKGWAATHIQDSWKKFQANNFGITDRLHSIVGQGVYPHAAILNHSCYPNCLLRYKDGVIMEIVAARDIQKGEELTHSYVDLVKDTPTRRRHLMKLHGFLCQCQRCRGDLKVKLPKQTAITPKELYAAIVERYGMLYCGDSIRDNMESWDDVEMDEALTEYGTASVAGSASLQHTRNAEHSSPKALLRRQVFMLEETKPPLHLTLYEARGNLLSELLLVGRMEEALEQCKAIVAILLVAFAYFPNHPILGLQLYTMSDLLARDPDQVPAAIASYKWTLDIMRLSHGDDDDLVKGLRTVLEDLVSGQV